MTAPLTYHPFLSISIRRAMCCQRLILKLCVLDTRATYVVLWGNLVDEVAAEEGHSL